MINMNWTSETPKETGWYWFYGDIHLGSMSLHYRPDFVPQPQLYSVKLIKRSNGLIVVADGHSMSTKRFDPKGHGEGCIGYWLPMAVPELPSDFESLFQGNQNA